MVNRLMRNSSMVEKRRRQSIRPGDLKYFPRMEKSKRWRLIGVGITSNGRGLRENLESLHVMIFSLGSS